MKTFAELAKASLTATKTKSVEVNCNLLVNGEVWSAYECSVSHKDLLFFTDKGTATFLVDSYGGDPRAELFDWERD